MASLGWWQTSRFGNVGTASKRLSRHSVFTRHAVGWPGRNHIGKVSRHSVFTRHGRPTGSPRRPRL